MTREACKKKKSVISKRQNLQIKCYRITDQSSLSMNIYRKGCGLLSALPSLDGAMALSSHSRLVEVKEVKECSDKLSELGRRSSKSSRLCGL